MLSSRGVRFCGRFLLQTNRINVNVQGGPVALRPLSTSVKNSLKGAFKLGLAGVTVGALVGTGYTIHKSNQPRLHIINTETTIPILEGIPKITPSRQIRFDRSQTDLKLTLYQYQTCPFCCKVRAFLDYYGIPYDVVEVDPVLRQSIRWSPYKKVPILVANVEEGQQPLNDSTMIISALATYLRDQKDLRKIVECYPNIDFVDQDGTKKSDILNKYFLMLGEPVSGQETIEERKWRKWTDEVLVHMISPNVYRTKEEAIQAFNWFSEAGEWEKHFPTWERNLIIYVGASAMWMIGKRLKRKYNLKDDVRQSLYDECDKWAKAIHSKGGKYMGGDSPNLADLSVYGVLCSIEGCTAFQDALENTKIKNWYFSMKESVSNHEGAQLI